MSTVASVRLPAIQHPSSRLGDPELISLRGYSTDGGRDQRCWVPPRGTRPRSPGTESLDSAFRSESRRSDISSLLEKGKRGGLDIPENIPEGDEVIPAQDKSKLPAFRESLARRFWSSYQYEAGDSVMVMHCEFMEVWLEMSISAFESALED